jgi:hypothetical protein
MARPAAPVGSDRSELQDLSVGAPSPPNSGFQLKQPEDADQHLRSVIEEDDEEIIEVLGREFISQWITPVNFRKSILILTDRRLYQTGMHFEPDEEGNYRKIISQNVEPVADLNDIGRTEIAFSPWVVRISWPTTILGVVITLAGFIDGSGLGIVIGLLIGAIWMVMPGALMVLHSKSYGESYLNFTHKEGISATSRKLFSEEGVATFTEK